MTGRPLQPGQTATIRAAVYVRISSDRAGAGLGVARQEEDCRALCARLGWQVASVYPDNDVSAYSGRRRPQWERLNADVAAGLIDAIVCWHVDRLTRSPRELEDVIDLHDRHGIQLATCTGDIDLSTPTGRLIARTLGAAARHEAEHKGERQRRQLRQAAEQGRPHGGQRGYGYTVDRSAIIESEAEVIREMTRRALAGESIKDLARELNARGLRTVSGGPWSRQALRAVLASARISGRREYKPTDSYEPGHRCGLCGARMSGRAHAGRPRYMCVKDPGRPGCGRIAVFADLAEAEARDKILTALNESPALLPRLLAKQASASAGPAGADPATRLRGIDERREELAAAWATGEINRKEWATAKRVLDEQAAQLTSRLTSSAQALALAQFAALDGDMWQRWEHPQMTTSARRALIQACVTAITVYPATPGRRWDSDRIQPDWIA